MVGGGAHCVFIGAGGGGDLEVVAEGDQVDVDLRLEGVMDLFGPDDAKVIGSPDARFQ